MPDLLARVRAALAEARLDALVIGTPIDDVFGQYGQNRRYLSGFTGSTGTLLITPARATLAVDFRYVEQAGAPPAADPRSVAPPPPPPVPNGFSLFHTEGRLKQWFPGLVAEARLAGRRLGLSRADFTYGDFLALQDAVAEMPAADRPELLPAPPVVEELRRIKSPEELAAIQRAIDIADAAFARVAPRVVPGAIERDVARALDRAFLEEGAESPSFATIVASGPAGAMPHAQPRDVPVAAGAPVVIDMGARAGGYCSDLTRTVVAGPEDARFREIYGVVLEAQANAIARVEAGMSGAVAHALAWDVIDRHGYGEQFGHGLGHGVGLQVHEAPYLGKTSEDTLAEGMVFTIEPGIYLPGWGGVRIEDVVVLEGGRARVLSHAAKLIPAGV
jgi:Xaa-Pro aminopeptidase